MLDPTRYSLDAATVGFRKRMNLDVDWDAFKLAMQTQNEGIKVRRELEETPINEVHVMGGQQFGYAGNSKFNEKARQNRQMNGYTLRSFLATGGPLIVPSKRSDPLIATQGTMGHAVFVINSADTGQSTSAFTEPLYGMLDSNAMSMGRAGLEAMSESIGNPYQKLQFMLNMHESASSIKDNQDKFNEIRGYNKQEDIKTEVDRLNEGLAKGESKRQYYERKKRRAEDEAGPNDEEEMVAEESGGPRARLQNPATMNYENFNQYSTRSRSTGSVNLDLGTVQPSPMGTPMSTPSKGLSETDRKAKSAFIARQAKQIALDNDQMNVPVLFENSIVNNALTNFPSPGPSTTNIQPSMGSPGTSIYGSQVPRSQVTTGFALTEARKIAAENALNNGTVANAMTVKKERSGMLELIEGRKIGPTEQDVAKTQTLAKINKGGVALKRTKK